VTDQPGAELPPVAYDAAIGIRVDLVPAPPIRLHAGGFVRVDANSPAHHHGGRFYLFFSHYQPIGHSYRRVGADLATLGPPEPVRLIGDDTPGGIRSTLADSFWFSRTRARSSSCPTSKRTTTIDWPGLDVE